MLDQPDNLDRVLRVKLDGEVVVDGRLPFSVLATKLEAAQAAVYNIALGKNRGPVAARGRWNKQIRAACELQFVSSQSGSLVINAELADHSILPEMPDLGKEVLHDLRSVVIAIDIGDDTNILNVLPDRTARARTLRSLQDLCPRPGEALRVSLGNGSGDYYAKLTELTRRKIIDFFKADVLESDYDVQMLVGWLVEIRVRAGTPHIVILTDSREINCLFPTEMEETISHLIAGSLVEVSGRVQLTPDGSVRQVDEIFDITTIDLRPFVVRTFTWDDRRYHMREPVICQISYEGGWVYECPRYRLHSFSNDRQEALQQFYEEFACLYDGLVNEKDDDLSQDALVMKRRLTEDVERVTETG